MTLTLEQADTIIGGAFAHAAAAGLKPLAVVVLDAGGHLKAFARQDGAATGRFEVARGKANVAASLGVSSRAFEAMALDRPHFLVGVSGVLSALGGVVPVAGGVVVVDHDGAAIGAVGISGDTSDNDEAAALAGLRAAGLEPRS